ncbi:hypothetical protein OG936_40090 (plasmid) [Streptomyces sp. NBC_00846]|uniref:hypothetical protein n=1 Tax=Streptomyces sp. NBC_00846 TaxID=2975849 RepID=UPI002F917AD2|nr:hypothetical protein OG936_40090 [Streptomyces sp. NBC_00846]
MRLQSGVGEVWLLRRNNQTRQRQLCPQHVSRIEPVHYDPEHRVLEHRPSSPAQLPLLSGLPKAKRLSFLSDMDQLGEAVERACRRLDPAFRRVNLEILGNTDPFLHAHVWPRFEWEPADVVGAPVWLYPRERWSDEQFRLGPQHDVLREAIGSELDQLRLMA